MWKQAPFISFWKTYYEFSVSLIFCILCLVFVNGPQALHANQGCLKCIWGDFKNIYLLLIKTSLLFHSFYILHKLVNTWKKRGTTKVVLLKGVYISSLFNNLLVSFSLINFNFLLSHTSHFDKKIILSIFTLCILLYFK